MILPLLTSCDDDDEGGPPPGPQLTGNSEQYNLFSKSDPAISGIVEFAERDDGVTVITINLNGTSIGGDHPSHIHANNAADGGTILVDLSNVDGETGTSVTEISTLNDGTGVTYNELINIDGYINVHLSTTDLVTLVAQGDVGTNVLTGNSQSYPLGAKSDPSISGTVTFAERLNGETLVTVELNGTTTGGDHPSHIHSNTAVEGGGIAVDLTNVNGETGLSLTNIDQLNDGTMVAYSDLTGFDGYINVHLSATDLATLVAQGDIGQNAFTGSSEEYMLFSKSDPSISGTATFAERINGETLVTLELEGTIGTGDHPSHIHVNTAVEGGGIAVDLQNVDGTSGISATNISELNDGTAITYAEMLDFNGYINVHLSAADLATLVAQGDIGQNELTENFVVYPLTSISDPGISGNATFAQRKNGFTLITIQLDGTSPGGNHPSHIHENDAATGGGILLSLTNVDGANGISQTSASILDDGTAITYDEFLTFNGYINVHLSEQDLATLIAQGDIGANAD
jgi:hypothetical protein